MGAFHPAKLSSGFLFFFCLLLTEPGLSQSEPKPTRPNIVWIVCEDMSPHLGVYGEKIAKTPVLDQLASEGRMYSNVFTTAGVCAPSRAAIITGCLQTTIGAMHMRTLGMSASAKGAYPANFKTYSAMPGPDVRCFPELLRAAGYYCTNNAKEDYQFEEPPTVWDESSNKAHWRNRARKDQPFFSIFNFNVTHESQVWARNKEPLLVDPDSVIVPPYYPDDTVSRKVMARFLSNVMEMDELVGNVIRQLKEDGLYENTVIFFYSDHGDGLPYVKRELYDRGLRVPMIIKAPFISAGSTDGQLISFVDLAPTVLSIAGVKIQSYMQGRAFLGDQQSPEPRKYFFAARDRIDSEYDRVRVVGDGRYKYFKNEMPEKPYYQNIGYRMQNPLMPHLLKLYKEEKLNAVQSHWFRKSKPKEELFDTWTDPLEMNDLALDPAYAEKLSALRRVQDEWNKQHVDWGQLNEIEMVKAWWKGAEHAPQTATATYTIQDRRIHIQCKTEGASIGYRLEGNTTWHVYTGPIPTVGLTHIEIIAQRIGYLPSEKTSVQVQPSAVN